MAKDRIFDPLRGKSVRALPEERVRRQLVDWLLKTVGVPARLIAVEYGLSQINPRSRKRADVVVWKPSSKDSVESTGLTPWLLVECKAPGVSLSESVADQVRGYAAMVRANHILISNGAQTRVFRLMGERYQECEGLPEFAGKK
jgi:hypothetical protein